MNVENLQFMSRVAFFVAVAALLLSILLFFVFHIPQLFNELTGRAAKKFIENAKKKNENSESEPSFEASESLRTSGLVSQTQHSTAEKVVTTMLISPEETTLLSKNSVTQNAESKETDFFVIEEFYFTSSKEIIE